MSRPSATHIASSRAVQFRKDLTPSELAIWQLVRRNKLGVRFRRQEPIGPYIVDFICFAHKVVIEADGAHHDLSDHDIRRDEFLRHLGFRVLRFENHDIARYPEWVIDQVLSALNGGEIES